MPAKTKKNNSSKPNKKSNKVNEVKELKSEISDLKELLKKNEDRNVRLLAEFDNYKKRKMIEIDKLIKYEGFDFFKNLLSILDDIDRTLNIKEVKNEKSIYSGISMIKNKIISLLDSHNVVSFESVNEKFNPDIHEALMVKKTSKYQS